MTTIRRKQRHLLEKITKLGSRLIAIKAAPQGSANPSSPTFDPDAVYVSKRTLLELLRDTEVDPFEQLNGQDG